MSKLYRGYCPHCGNYNQFPEYLGEAPFYCSGCGAPMEYSPAFEEDAGTFVVQSLSRSGNKVLIAALSDHGFISFFVENKDLPLDGELCVGAELELDIVGGHVL